MNEESPRGSRPERKPLRDLGVVLDVADAAFLEDQLERNGIRAKVVPVGPNEPQSCRLRVQADRLEEARALVTEAEAEESAPEAGSSAHRGKRATAGVLVFLLVLRYGTRILGSSTAALLGGIALGLLTYVAAGQEDWLPPALRD